MAIPTSTLEDEILTLKKAYDALNRNDIPSFVEMFDPEIERVEFEGLPGGGAYHGIANVTAHVVEGRGRWAEGSCEPERFKVVGNQIIVLVYVHVRLKNETEWREGRVADVYTFVNGKAIQFRTFADEQLALEWVGTGT